MDISNIINQINNAIDKLIPVISNFVSKLPSWIDKGMDFIKGILNIIGV
ncbi:MAG: hypothetical protein M0R17_07125 [Candidatus Omnitrophica bacterium]|jgi:hypothetical protein|nr:hypothetical protein [Candidatus Omnitrophota bacterium]